tara:strand:- start:370 stop:753 length:384 start_codon:yes stop_codon:yes gene_type:complete
MANTDNIISFIAAEAITEFALVSTNAAGKIVITDAATDTRCIGVAQRACSTGDSVEVVISGRTRVIAGATITDSVSLVMAATDGKVVKHETSANYSIGSILPNINQVSSVNGDQILINFTGPKLLIP